MIENYFDEEMQYLYESGREFAKAHPDRARLLTIDAVGNRNPQVEQLFQGFAFLTARIREKLDDSFPELSEGLIDLLWPHLQQEIPSATIAEFKARPGSLQETTVLRRGVEIVSHGSGPGHPNCTFITTQDVSLNPIALVSTDVSVDTKGKGSLTLQFTAEAAVQWSKLRLDPLRLYLHAEMPVAVALHELLMRHTTGTRIAIESPREEITVDGPSAVTPAGLSPEERLLPGDARAYSGYQLLLEYFVYPEKFLFFDLHGLDAFKGFPGNPERFSVTIGFDRDIPREIRRPAETFRLFCSPAVNLFRRSIEPIPIASTVGDYLVVADANKTSSCFAHNVISVSGIDRASGERFTYEPRHSFAATGPAAGRYSTRYRRSFWGNREIILSIGGGSGESRAGREESVSVEAWCTNGSLPHEKIAEGDIACAGSGFSDAIAIKIITRPTLPCPPPPLDAQWTFLAHLGATYASLANAPALRSFLRFYDWSNAEGRRRRIDAIHDVAVKPAETFFHGGILRGIEFSVTVDEAGFSDINDMHLFGEALAAFLSRYASINSYIELVLVTRPAGRTLRWNSLQGKKTPV